MMVKIVAKNYIQEGKFDEVVALYKELVEKTRVEEGCIKYELFQDLNDARTVTMIEEWDSMEALAAHEKSEHFTRILPLLKVLMAGDTDFRIYNRII